MENYQIDNLDRGILEALMANARTAYAELAKQFGVSPDQHREPLLRQFALYFLSALNAAPGTIKVSA
jgi:hypothetical protein